MIAETNICEIKNIAGEAFVSVNEKMAGHTTLRMGGTAKVFVSVQTEEILGRLMVYLEENAVPYFVIGNGSNLLVSDNGYDGVIVKLSGEFEKITCDTSRIKAGAAGLLSSIAKCALDEELTGFEFASGIPGSLGGAIVMNAGAYGGEMKDVVENVRMMVIQNGNIKITDISNDEMHFGYRRSLITEDSNAKYIVLSVDILLSKGDKENILAVMKDLNTKRREKQPLEYPSAGSTFKRPEGYFAAKLIEDAGLKGFCVGGAAVSTKHAGFCINYDNATASDFYGLIKKVQEKVFEDSAVMLETEVIMLGEF